MKKPNIKIDVDAIRVGDVITNEDQTNELTVLAAAPNGRTLYCRDSDAELLEVPLSDFRYAIIAQGY